ncbi:XdhC family protein [Rhizobium wuzhouense]|uniref:XdhC/CoxF family protein n=1 Tax=Rhizobium wuzhouense TaxID=1986026 RepID=A0ABX5NXQ9_9HYPH|nr:XdhC family protein [Rhizobium wuzhouense]PYB75197.1 XdhC/CoxF family protein [Rhizobium wuzhouense]
MEVSLLQALNAARRARRAAVVVTDLAGGPSRLVVEGDSVDGPLSDEIGQRLRSGKSGLVTVDDQSWFLNVHLPPARIVVIGAVHISQALASMATLAGFAVRIVDPRTAFATPERFEGIDLVPEWPQDALARQPLDRFTALVAVTHDPKIDDPGIIAALKAGCFYIGALGSRKTHAKRLERLAAEGFGTEETGRISAPIGLDIGAATPAEIAVATLADIIQALRRRPLFAHAEPLA